jgi:uncharacterized membrane protein YedE/YeeE
MSKVQMFRILAALASGAVFGFGLSLSGMLDPTRVRGFLDVAGHWDPSLAFVLAGAVVVAMLGTVLTQRMKQPLLDEAFHLPTNKRIDRPLSAGAWRASALAPPSLCWRSALHPPCCSSPPC